MRYEFLLPDLGEGLTEAEIGNWHVAAGDTVAEDQPLVEVETAKATIEIPSPAAGTVIELGGRPGDVLPVGAVLVAFDIGRGSVTQPPGGPSQPRSGEHAEAAPLPVPSAHAATATEATSGRAGSPLASGRPGRVLASPSTRKYALSLGVDLSRLTGSGPAGRVTRDDVDRALHHDHSPAGPAADADGVTASPVPRAPQGQRAADQEVPLRGIRREITRAMTQSWQQIPHITEFREVDATRLTDAHRALRNRTPDGAPRLTLLPLLVLACTAALARHRILNASIDVERDIIIYRGQLNVGIATSSTDGLVVPVLHDADRLSLFDISNSIAKLAEAARSRRIQPAQLRGGTFTISNFGSYGTWLGTPVINPPQAAIAGFGRIRDTVVAASGQPVVRPTLPIAVSADHRLIDGHVLGAFVNDLASLLENPVLLLGEVR